MLRNLAISLSILYIGDWPKKFPFGLANCVPLGGTHGLGMKRALVYLSKRTNTVDILTKALLKTPPYSPYSLLHASHVRIRKRVNVGFQASLA